MTRWTDDDLILTVNRDLTGKEPYVTISQLRTKLTIDYNHLGMSVSNNVTTLVVSLSQLQTSQFAVGVAEIDVNYIGSDGKRKHNNIDKIEITRNLLERVIEYNGQ